MARVGLRQRAQDGAVGQLVGDRLLGASIYRSPLFQALLIVVVGVAVVGLFGKEYVGGIFVLALSYGIVTVGMAVQIGFSQQVVFSQCVFFGLGAYGVAVLNTHAGMASLVAALVMTVAGGAIAWLLGAVVCRSPGLALAVASLMLPLAATEYLSFNSFLGGSIGLPLTGNLWPGGGNITVANGMLVVLIVAIIVFLAARLLASDIGLELFVMGVDQGAAEAVGINTGRRKLELFVVGSMCATLGGGVFAGTQLFVPYTVVGATAELSFLIMLFVGGRRSVLGAVLGAFVIEYFQGINNFVSVHILVIEGVVITAILIVEPEGLAGILAGLTRAARARFGAGQEGGALVSAPAPGGIPLREADDLGVPVAPRAGSGLFGQGRDGPTAGEVEGGLLECRNVTKYYGGLGVLNDVSFQLPSRGIFGLCGPNGAGKTTLLNVIAGTVNPDRGSVWLAGQDLGRLDAPARFHRGCSRTFQTVKLVAGRSVLDNVAVACLRSNGSGMARAVGPDRLEVARAQAMEALEYLGIADSAERSARSLTLEGQRLVELARAVASHPRVLLLDEPASGMSAAQRERLKAILTLLGSETCVLLVEHDLELVAAVSDRILVLAEGNLVFNGSPAEFRSAGPVQELLVGLAADR